MKNNVWAIIEIGSHLTTLTIAKTPKPKIIFSEQQLTGLNMGSDTDGQKYAKLEALLQDYVDKAKSQTENMLIVGTNIARKQSVKPKLKEMVHRLISNDLIILSGEEEAYFNAVATLRAFPHKKNMLTFDIGGGSTEFAVIDDRNITAKYSFEFGGYTVLGKKPNLNKISKDIQNKLKQIQSSTKHELIGIGKIPQQIYFLANMLKTTSSCHKKKIKAEELNSTYLRLKALSGVKSGTEEMELMHAGVFLTKQIVDFFQVSRLIISNKGIAFGMLCQDNVQLKKLIGGKVDE